MIREASEKLKIFIETLIYMNQKEDKNDQQILHNNGGNWCKKWNLDQKLGMVDYLFTQ